MISADPPAHRASSDLPAENGGEGNRSASLAFVESLLFAVLFAFFLIVFVAQTFQIPSASMQPALLPGDRILVNKFIFDCRGAWYERALPCREVRRNEVIVFQYPFDRHLDYVGRVIGLPGDRIRIADRAVYVNGFTSPEPYVITDARLDDSFGGNFPPVANSPLTIGLQPEWAAGLMGHVVNGELIVPPDSYFVLGDNRDQSWDSRYWGFVDRGAIIGRPVVIYWSRNWTDPRCQPPGVWIHDALLVFQHAGCVNWRRLFHEVH